MKKKQNQEQHSATQPTPTANTIDNVTINIKVIWQRSELTMG